MPRAFYKSHYFTNHGHVLNHLEYLEEQGALFTGIKEIGLGEAQAQASEFMQARKWWFVFSLNREDQQRLQVDRSYLQQLVETQKATWAKAYNIPIERLHIYASFHDTAHHPHIHVVIHGETAADGYILRKPGQKLGNAFKNCRETVKGTIANEIFREDTLHLKTEKSEQRKELNERLEKLLLQIGRSSHPVHPELQNGLLQLADSLAALSGKHQYGYLPRELKTTVDELLQRSIDLDPQLAQIHQMFRASQKELISYLYVDSPITLAQKMAEWEKEFYHPPKGKDTRRHNLIIQAADSLFGFLAEKYDTTAPAAEHEAIPFETVPDVLDTKEPLEVLPAGIELYKKETDGGSAASTQTAPGLTAEEEKALAETERQAVRTMERELSGRIGDELATAMRTLKEQGEIKKGGWENQQSSVQDAILDLERRLLEKIPELNSTVLEISKTRACTPDEALESMELLHYRVLQYVRHISDENYISLKSLQAERDNSRYFQMFSFAVQREIVAILDQNPELGAIAAEIQSQPRTISEAGKEMPTSYKTLPAALKKEVNELIETCWEAEEVREAAQTLYDKFSLDENREKYFKYLLQGTWAPSICQRAAVKALLSFSVYEPDSAEPVVGDEAPAAPETTAGDQASTAPKIVTDEQAPAALKTANDGRVPPTPRAAIADSAGAGTQTAHRENRLEISHGLSAKEKLSAEEKGKREELQTAVRNLRYSIEQKLYRDPALQRFLGERLLKISAMANPETGVQPYYKMSTQQRKAVDDCLCELLNLPPFRAMAQEAFAIERNFIDEGPTALHTMLVDYAAAATKEHPVDLTLKEKRTADYKALCALDKLLCDTLNAAKNTPAQEEVQALVQKLFDKARTPREKAEYVPPDYYRQLSPPEQEQLATWLKSIYDKSYPLKRAIQERSLLEQCADPAVWFQKRLEETTEFQNLAVQHLKEKFLEPDKRVLPKFEASDYHAKNPAAAMRGLLHLIGLSMQNDTNRNQSQATRPAGKKTRFKAKKIHTQSMEERRNRPDALEP